MKQLLIIRVPKTTTPVELEEFRSKVFYSITPSYDIVAFPDNVERWEFEIVYNLHFKLDQPEGFDLEAIRKQAIRFAVKSILGGVDTSGTTDKIYYELMMSE